LNFDFDFNNASKTICTFSTFWSHSAFSERTTTATRSCRDPETAVIHFCRRVASTACRSVPHCNAPTLVVRRHCCRGAAASATAAIAATAAAAPVAAAAAAVCRQSGGLFLIITN